MSDMTPGDIYDKAEAYRHTEPSYGNYKQMLNDAWVLMREVARNLKELDERVNGLEHHAVTSPKVEGADAGSA